MELQETSTVCGTKNCKVRNLEPGSRNRHTVSGYGYRGATWRQRDSPDVGYHRETQGINSHKRCYGLDAPLRCR